MYGGGQTLGGKAAGGGGSKPKFVDNIAERDALIGQLADGRLVVVADATADATVTNPLKPRATYLYREGQDPLWIKETEEESIDITLYSNLPDAAVTSQTYGDIPAGTAWASLKNRSLMGVILDFIFATVHYSYRLPIANISSIGTTVEVGQVFNAAVSSSYTQRDGGAANRVVLKKNGATLQDTATAALDFSNADNGLVLNDGGQIQYQATIYYDEGPIRQDVSGKGLDSPGRIEAGADNSPTTTFVARRKIFFSSSVAQPTNSAAVRALASSQNDNDYTFTIPLQDGSTNIAFAIPANRAVSSISFVGLLTLNQTTEIVGTEQIISVEGGGAGYAQNYRVYFFQPPSPYTASRYDIVLTNA
jgi:hypothetical protein